MEGGGDVETDDENFGVDVEAEAVEAGGLLVLWLIGSDGRLVWISTSLPAAFNMPCWPCSICSSFEAGACGEGNAIEVEVRTSPARRSSCWRTSPSQVILILLKLSNFILLESVLATHTTDPASAARSNTKNTWRCLGMRTQSFANNMPCQLKNLNDPL